jgi:hypothetical protein
MRVEKGSELVKSDELCDVATSILVLVPVVFTIMLRRAIIDKQPWHQFRDVKLSLRGRQHPTPHKAFSQLTTDRQIMRNP